VERIEGISLKEGLKLDSGSLHKLAEKTECDIRSCLSTMQFLKGKSGTARSDFLSHLGNKDKSKGIFTVWEDIFFLPQGYVGCTLYKMQIHNPVIVLAVQCNFSRMKLSIAWTVLFAEKSTTMIQIPQSQMRDLRIFFERLRPLVTMRNYKVVFLRITSTPSSGTRTSKP
jgi:hypothetical protein